MLVRFAMVCDKCRERQPEYCGYLNCRVCGDEVCEKCCAEYDADPPGHAVCRDCATRDLEYQVSRAEYLEER